MTRHSRMYHCNLVYLLVALALLASAALADTERPLSMAEELEGDNYLPIGMTPEEEAMRHLIGEGHRATPPPTAPVRNPGEFEPMTGVIVRYPFGLSGQLLRELAEDATLWVIVANASQQQTVHNYLQGYGTDMDHVDYIFGQTNTIWTRDYGPWFTFDGNGDQWINDHIYNRPRPDDDQIPWVIGAAWGIPVSGMDLVTAGGNYMSDGRGIGMSTRLVLSENSGMSSAEIDALMHDYLGLDTYYKLEYVEVGGIHHIDCWGKFLTPEKLLIKEVDTWHSDYNRIEANVAYLSSINSSYGRPYEIVRVYTPNNEPYTNSLILNDKVFVPQYGTSWDDEALAAYEEAMPGYEVLGYTGSWYTNDAIHCRAMGVTDRYMLHIDHVPLLDEAPTESGYRVDAFIYDHSEDGLKTDSCLVYWKTEAMPDFEPVTMMAASHPDSYYAYIPQQGEATEISYYLFAADYSGRRECHPYIAPGDAHTFSVTGTAVPGESDPSLGIGLRLAQNKPNPFNPMTSIEFTLPTAGPAELIVYDATGREIKVLASAAIESGTHRAVWDGTDDSGRDVASGIYFFRLMHDGVSVTRKGVLLK